MDKKITNYITKKNNVTAYDFENIIDYNMNHRDLMFRAYINGFTNINWLNSMIYPLADEISRKLDLNYETFIADDVCQVVFSKNSKIERKSIVIVKQQQEFYYRLKNVEELFKLPNNINDIIKLLK